MNTLEITLVVALAWSVGVNVCLFVFGDTRYDRTELLALAAWPVWVPFALTVRTFRRHQNSTCKDCGFQYMDRGRLAEHHKKYPSHSCTQPEKD